MTIIDDTQVGPDLNVPVRGGRLGAMGPGRRSAGSKDDLLESYRTALRQEVREQELAALVAEIAQLRSDALDRALRQTAEHNELVAEMKRIQAPPPASPSALEALTQRGLGANSGQRDVDIPEGFELVSDAFLDFIEIADMLSAAIVKRKPLNAKVRSFYNDKGQRELHYREKGVYGLNPGMYMANLVLVTDDPDLGPYVKGTYMEYGQTVDMSPEQIGRIMSETLDAVRELWNEAKEEA